MPNRALHWLSLLAICASFAFAGREGPITSAAQILTHVLAVGLIADLVGSTSTFLLRARSR